MTFDDGYDTQFQAGRMLADHGMRGTFYINSAALDTSRHLTWAQVDQLAAAGNEIGGHTSNHVDLRKVPPETAERQICDDRSRLLARGYAVTDFAYPYGRGYNNPAIRSLVQKCGYKSARDAWGIGAGVYAETIPPADIWAIRSPSSDIAQTLDQMEAFVVGAESHGGGWVPFYFHDVCDGCTSSAVAPAALSGFMDWLASRAASGTVVRTVADVVGGRVEAGPDFSISVLPTSRAVVAGSSTTFTVSTAVTSGSAQTVSLAVSGLPAGAAASFNPTSVTAGTASTLTVTPPRPRLARHRCSRSRAPAHRRRTPRARR